MACRVEQRLECWGSVIVGGNVYDELSKYSGWDADSSLPPNKCYEVSKVCVGPQETDANVRGNNWYQECESSEEGETVGRNSWDGPIVFCIDEENEGEYFLESRDNPETYKKSYPGYNTPASEHQLCKRCLKEIVYDTEYEVDRKVVNLNSSTWRKKLLKNIVTIKDSTKKLNTFGANIREKFKFRNNIRLFERKISSIKNVFRLVQPHPKGTLFTLTGNRKSLATSLLRSISIKTIASY